MIQLVEQSIHAAAVLSLISRCISRSLNLVKSFKQYPKLTQSLLSSGHFAFRYFKRTSLNKSIYSLAMILAYDSFIKI